MNQVSVVIPSVDWTPQLQKCLRSILTQQNVRLETWVVFNPNMPKSEVLEGWPDWIRFVRSDRGVNRARNEGVRRSTCERVLFLDSDCELVDLQHIEKLNTLWDENPTVDGVGGEYKLSFNSSEAAQAYQALQMQWLRTQVINSKGETKALIGGHMLLNRKLLLEAPFDEKILFGGAEREFFVRLSNLSNKFIWTPELKVLHESNLTRKDLIKKARLQGLGDLYIQKKMKRLSIPVQNSPRLSSLNISNPEVLQLVDEYIRVFSKYARKNKKTWRHPFFRLLEHMNIAEHQVKKERNFSKISGSKFNL